MTYILATIFSLLFTYYMYKTTPQPDNVSITNILMRCGISWLCGIGVLTCLMDIL